ncbi:MAG TPA: hypothetical protein VM051_07455 [Usitatibacter sp.]|nr:hypothetical protein [Usitatibacter sp.]
MQGTAQLTRRLAGPAIGALIRFIAVTFLAVASFALVMSWHSGPQRVIDAHGAQRFTGRMDARIVEGWVAMAFDPATMGTSKHWRGFAKVSTCAVVEYDAQWGPARRGFCGPRYGFIDTVTLHDLREMSPGVPFDFARDANGFSVPEIRMSKAARAYLAAQPAMSQLGKAASALEEMRRGIDRPVDAAIVSWSVPAPAFPLVFDPEHPGDPWPAGFIEARRNAEPIWLPAILATAIGVAFWLVGMHLLLAGLPLAARWVLAGLPLLAVPWWAQELPNALRHLHGEIAATVAETLGDITASGSMEAADPAQTRLHGGERVSFDVAHGLYADTMGRLRFARPDPAPRTADAALAALTASAQRQVRGMSADDRAALFARLRRDHADGLPHAGLLFVRSAKDALMDAASPAPVAMSAREFLSDWAMSPVRPRRDEPAFEERITLFRELLEVPVTVIAYPASIAIESAQAAPTRRKR